MRVFNLLVFSRAEFTKMVCKYSLVERLDLLPMAAQAASGACREAMLKASSLRRAES
ncbi:MAG: hypothetical protein ACRDIV_13475 [Ktedonobacteraceae bacterium]